MRKAWLLTVVLLTTPSAAQTRDQPRVNVAIHIAPAGETEQQVRAVLEELLAQLPVAVRYDTASEVNPRQIITPLRNAEPMLARVWVDFTHSRRATIYLVDRAWERVLIRHVATKGEADEVTREQVAQIIEAALEALLEGARIGVTREEASQTLDASPPVEPARVQPAAQGTSTRVGFGMFYEAQTWSLKQPFFHGAGLMLRAESGSKRLLGGAWLSGQLRFPVSVDQEPVGVRFETAAVRLLGSALLKLTPTWWFRAGLGGGVDFVTIYPRVVSSAPYAADDARTTLVPMARSMIATGYVFTGSTSLWLAVAADFDVLKSRYFVERLEREETVFQPWRVRPSASIGVSTDIFHKD